MVAWQSIQAAVDWIEDHLAEDIPVRSLAAAANLSPAYFQRLFKRLIGKTVGEYIKLRRLARVADRLIFNGDTILRSCVHYGFESHETFCQAFKEAYGVTPTQFRRHTKPTCPFPKPILTEKGLYAMDYKVAIEDLGELNYLAIPHLTSMDDDADSTKESLDFWRECFRDRSIERLKAVCGADEVYALFCNTYDPKTKLISYDIACINHTKSAAPEFRAITLRPSKYAVVSGSYEAPMTMKQA